MIPLTAASAPIHPKEARAGILVSAWGFGVASDVPDAAGGFGKPRGSWFGDAQGLHNSKNSSQPVPLK